MRIRFTKMQGAGNDFVVLDETRARLQLSVAQYRWLADRHFGVGADQILSIRPSSEQGIDFEYVIHNHDGEEVEHCGNGARCFLRYVRDRGLTTQEVLRVKTVNQTLELCEGPDGRVHVNMGVPSFDTDTIGFDASGLVPEPMGMWHTWPITLTDAVPGARVLLALLSMGNPHAVQVVSDVRCAPVLSQGSQLERHPRFPNRVNVGYMQVLSRKQIRLRVFERGAGETLACGTGACAAVVAGIRLGLLDACVQVHTLGGLLEIEWGGAWGEAWAPVLMTGPATQVFEGVVDLPDEAGLERRASFERVHKGTHGTDD
jgi:diaminopimelate epimerase